MRWWKKRLCACVRLKGLATGNSLCEGDKVNRLNEMMVTHPLTKTSNIMLLRSHMANTKDWHPSNIVMATPPKSCESSHWCSMTTINVLWKSTHSIITSHSTSSHKITMSNHPDSLKSCATTQIWMLHDNPFISTISPNSQTTLSSWSIYYRVKLTSGLAISDST